MPPEPRLSKRVTHMALAGLLSIGLYLTAASLENLPRLHASVWLALGRARLTESTTRWMDLSLRVPRRYASLPDNPPWLKTVATLSVQGHDGVDGCWRVCLILDTPRQKSEHFWLLRGPTCEPDRGAQPPIQLPPGVTQV